MTIPILPSVPAFSDVPWGVDALGFADLETFELDPRTFIAIPLRGHDATDPYVSA